MRTAVTVSFLTLAFSKLWFVFNLRDPATRLWNNGIVRNGWIGAIALCSGLLLAAVYLPGLSGLLQTGARRGRLVVCARSQPGPVDCRSDHTGFAGHNRAVHRPPTDTLLSIMRHRSALVQGTGTCLTGILSDNTPPVALSHAAGRRQRRQVSQPMY